MICTCGNDSENGASGVGEGAQPRGPGNADAVIAGGTKNEDWGQGGKGAESLGVSM